ncbi:hypothetical protein OVY01_22750 [Robbsia sp. Bb-Pol-6]|uniref:Uncharacterized protein n=1 Tax=Robbsia betulipollinis TaxID=2981849 RepID=A0ABT3ZTT8_9BURK|nr:hypothetical protein [Robbsia betulipollinis]MCY0389961.1 hypothetical protein [Robbsia betulipollinis]
MSKPFNVATHLGDIEVKEEGVVENYVLDEESNVETTDGYYIFYTISVQAFGRIFDVQAQIDADDDLIVPSNDMVGDEMNSDQMDACPNYFALLQALVNSNFDVDFTSDDYDDMAGDRFLPEPVVEVDEALRDHLKMALRQAVAADA